MNKDLINKQLEQLRELAKEYARFSYLVSEENHPEYEESDALENLEIFFEASMEQAYKEENQAWLKGERCYTCGNEMESHPTTDTCSQCFLDN